MEASCSIPDGVYPAGCAGCGEALEGLEVVLRGGHPFGARRDGAEVDDSSLPARRAECDMCGRETDVIVYDPSPEVDSVLEHLATAFRLATCDRQRQHLRAAVLGVLEVRRVNDAERQCTREATGRVDRPDDGPWSFRRVVREARAPLADLSNPIIRGKRRANALTIARHIVAEAPAEIVGTLAKPNVRLNEELGVNRYTLLLEIGAGLVPA